MAIRCKSFLTESVFVQSLYKILDSHPKIGSIYFKTVSIEKDLKIKNTKLYRPVGPSKKAYPLSMVFRLSPQ